MPFQNMMNCALESFCIVVCLIMLFHQMQLKTKTKTTYWFKWVLLANTGMLLGDIPYWALQGSRLFYAHFLLNAGLALHFASSGVLMFSFFAYIYAYLQDKAELRPVIMKLGVCFMSLQILLAVSSPVTGAVFYITKDNLYHRGVLFPLSQITYVLTISLAVWLFRLSWHVITTREKLYFCFYFIIAIASEAIQLLFPKIALLNVTLTLVFLVVNLFINEELDEKLRYSDMMREQEKIESMKRLQQNHTKLIDQTITALSSAVEAKDRYTKGHSQRVACYARAIVRRMGWDEQMQQRVYYTGLLHDVGKIRIPDYIINKPAKLTAEEYEEIKLHSLTGYYILKEITSISEFACGARWHHERYDGKGYPNGLSGENIPLIARIIGVADAYDAMSSNRSYRRSMSQEEVRQELLRGMGTQFDPKIAAIMLDMIDEDEEYQLRQPKKLRERVVLAVDDDPVVLKFLDHVLQQEPGYRLVGVSSGEEAMETIMKEKIDLVLLDVEMEGKDGFEVLEWIRNMCGALPVIFMTADKELAVINRAEEMGISGYLTKPLVPQMLRESINNVLHDAETAVTM